MDINTFTFAFFDEMYKNQRKIANSIKKEWQEDPIDLEIKQIKENEINL